MLDRQMRGRLVRLTACGAILFMLFPAAAAAKPKANPWSCASESGSLRMTARTAVEMVQVETGPDRISIIASPDQRFFAFVTRCGDLATNSNRFALWVYGKAAIESALGAAGGRPPRPAFRLVRRSMDDDPGISGLRWAADGRRLIFLSHRKSLERVEALDVSTGKVIALAEARKILAYDLTDRGIVYATPGNRHSSQPASIAPGGYLDPGIYLQKALGLARPEADWSGKLAIFARTPGRGPARLAARIGRKVYFDPMYLSASPDGRFAIIALPPADARPSWLNYQPPSTFLKSLLKAAAKAPEGDAVRQLHLVDLRTGALRPVLDAPIATVAGYGYSSGRAVWAEDSKSAVILATMLPLGGSGDELTSRRRHAYAVDLDVPSLKWTPIAELPEMGRSNGEKIPIVAFDPGTRRLTIQHRFHDPPGAAGARLQSYVRQDDGSWTASSAPAQAASKLTLQVERSLNRPAEISAIDAATGRTIRLTDLNPAVGRLDPGKAELFEWKDKRGRTFHGGLLFPPAYVAEQRLPLAIQTYGFSPDEFKLIGLDAPFAARALAARGMLVLQVPLLADAIGTPDEGPAHLDMFEGAIDALVRKGLVDRDRVGLVGFSTTCYQVKYAISSAPDSFKAAVASDGRDGGYFQYLLNYWESRNSFQDTYDAIYGGSPFKIGFDKIAAVAPPFRAGRVKAALLTQAIGQWSIIGQWEMHASLRSVGAPADMLVIPAGRHELQLPAQRYQSTEATVDWMSFWLAGREDLGVSSRTLEHWRQLRRLQDARSANAGSADPDAAASGRPGRAD